MQDVSVHIAQKTGRTRQNGYRLKRGSIYVVVFLTILIGPAKTFIVPAFGTLRDIWGNKLSLQGARIMHGGFQRWTISIPASMLYS